MSLKWWQRPALARPRGVEVGGAFWRRRQQRQREQERLLRLEAIHAPHEPHHNCSLALGLALAQGIPFEQIAGADTAFEAPPDGKLSPCFLCIPLTMAKPLKCPGSDIEFHAEPSLLLAPFDIYDREESLGQELAAYDPNDPQQLLLLLDRYFFPCCEQASWSTAHKVMLTRSLQAALQSLQYDFAAPLEDSHDDCFYLPATWQIQAPRQFFLNAYSILLKRWVPAFATAGFSPMPAENLRHLA